MNRNIESLLLLTLVTVSGCAMILRAFIAGDCGVHVSGPRARLDGARRPDAAG
jgi:hypothetical protein